MKETKRPEDHSVSKKESTRTDPEQPARSHQAPLAENACQCEGAQGSAPCEDTSEPSVEAGPQLQLEQIVRELDDAKNQALRSQADLENYRKRVAREMDDLRRYATIPLIRDLLPVWDDMHRAIEAAEKNHETASLLEGFKMVVGQLENLLARHQCTPIEALDRPFDPNLHQAILQQPTDAHPPNTVVQVALAGFVLHDRVVRPSQVIVSAALPGAADPGAAETSPSGSQSAEGASDTFAENSEESKHEQTEFE